MVDVHEGLVRGQQPREAPGQDVIGGPGPVQEPRNGLRLRGHEPQQVEEPPACIACVVCMVCVSSSCMDGRVDQGLASTARTLLLQRLLEPRGPAQGEAGLGQAAVPVV